MHYVDGSPVNLGDVVSVPVPGGTAKARVVMLGDTYAHLDIDPRFVTWVTTERMLETRSVVVEWLEGNPFAHSDPAYAPAGNYMFTAIDEHVCRAV
jgi:hypothetical protein